MKVTPNLPFILRLGFIPRGRKRSVISKGEFHERQPIIAFVPARLVGILAAIIVARWVFGSGVLAYLRSDKHSRHAANPHLR
jgi:hypothetical protein